MVYNAITSLYTGGREGDKGRKGLKWGYGDKGERRGRGGIPMHQTVQFTLSYILFYTR